jgi:hypothetical protein
MNAFDDDRDLTHGAAVVACQTSTACFGDETSPPMLRTAPMKLRFSMIRSWGELCSRSGIYFPVRQFGFLELSVRSVARNEYELGWNSFLLVCKATTFPTFFCHTDVWRNCCCQSKNKEQLRVRCWPACALLMCYVRDDEIDKNAGSTRPKKDGRTKYCGVGVRQIPALGVASLNRREF